MDPLDAKPNADKLMVEATALAAFFLAKEHSWQDSAVIFGLAAKMMATRAKFNGLEDADTIGAQQLHMGYSQELTVTVRPVAGSSLH